jgi:hypothetical protein
MQCFGLVDTPEGQMARVRRRPQGPRWLRRLQENSAWIALAAVVAAVLAAGALVGVPKQFADAWTAARGKPDVTTTDLDKLDIAVDVQKYLDILGPADVKEYRTVAAVDPSDPNSGQHGQKWVRYEWNSHKGLTVVALTSDSGEVMAYSLKTYQKDIAPAIKELGGRLGRSTFKEIVENQENTGTTLTLETRDAEVPANTTTANYEETYHIANPAWVSIVLSQGGDRSNDPHTIGDLDVSAPPTIADVFYGTAGNTMPCVLAQCREKPSRALQDFRASNRPDAFSLIEDNVDAASDLLV